MGWKERAAAAATAAEVLGNVVSGATGHPTDQASQLGDYQQRQNEQRMDHGLRDSTRRNSSDSGRSAEDRRRR